MTTIELQGCDGEIFTVELAIALKSTTIKDLLENLGIDADHEGDHIVPIPMVKSAILEKVRFKVRCCR